MKHKVSIIVPVYGVEPYIEDCLQSVAAQDYDGPIECVIVDDCGPDNSMDIVKRFVNNYSGQISFKLIYRENNGGVSAARNTGIANATGDYIYLLDSDDEITPDCIRLLQEPLQRKDYDFVIGAYRLTRPLSYLASSLKYSHDCEISGEQVLTDYCHAKWFTFSVNKLCKIDLFKSGMYFKEGIVYEDVLWSFNLALKSNSFYAITKETYIYKVREGSIMTKSNYDIKYNSRKIFIDEMHKLAIDYGKQKNFIVSRRIVWWFYDTVAFQKKYSKESLYNIYKKLRSGTSIDNLPRFYYLFKNPIYFVRDVHFYFPIPVGYALFRCISYPIKINRH